MKTAIIFDMDGVIVDSEEMHCRANIRALKKFGVDLTEEYCYSFVGSTLRHMMDVIINTYHLSITLDDLIDVVNKEKELIVSEEGYKEVPGVIDYIKEKKEKGFRLAVASSSSLSDIHKVLSYFNLNDMFDVVESGQQIEHPKPAPDIFLKALASLNVSADQCFIIEDSTHGVAAAKAANITCAGFYNPHSGKQDLTPADVIFDSFSELDNLLHIV